MSHPEGVFGVHVYSSVGHTALLPNHGAGEGRDEGLSKSTIGELEKLTHSSLPPQLDQ